MGLNFTVKISFLKLAKNLESGMGFLLASMFLSKWSATALGLCIYARTRCHVSTVYMTNGLDG